MLTNIDIYSPPLLTFAAISTITFMIVGLLGNLLTIIALLRCPRVRNVAAAFIISLCAADFLFCAVALPFAASRFITDSWVHGDVLCKIVPLIRYGNVGVSLLCIAMITINRYIMIAHYGIYTKIYKPVWIACMIIFSWALSFGMQIPTFLGYWGKYSYDHNLRTCSITKDMWGRSSKTSLFMIGFVIPCLIIVGCYARIFWVVHSSESRMRKHATTNSTGKEKRESKAKRNEWRITKMVLAIFLSFLLCYLPITIIKVYDGNVRFPVLHVVSYLLLYMSACINPIIYVIMNHQYRQAYKTILLCKRPRLSSLTPGSSYGGKSKEDSKTMVSQVSIAMTPVKSKELADLGDRQL
ncbi:G-protein coupled receptor moody isoform X2 [Rhodnius prolixus]|uniref:G-protein coupled receptor moody isoform X2 n=1 Tax=Rhodnius prolixus TaxID=13249 RepID=UPI003D1886F4